MSTLEALRMNIRAMRCAGNHPFVRRGRGGIYQNNVMITVQVTYQYGTVCVHPTVGDWLQK